MKQLGKWIGAFLAGMVLLCCVPAAADAQPRIVLKASGIENQFILRLEEFGSRFESVQFDICIDRDTPAPQVLWQDDSPAHFQRVETAREGGKTVLTVYIDRLRPIAGSGSAELASLTFSQALPAAAFSAGDTLIALDENQEETLFTAPAFAVTGVAAGDGGSSSESSGSSSSSGGGASDSGSGSAGGSGSGWDSDFVSVLGWEAVSGREQESGGKKTLAIRVSSGQVIGAEIFRRAQERGLLLSLDYGDYIWSFDPSQGVSIPSGRVFYDLSVKPLRLRGLSAAVEGSDLLQFEIAYSGPLPCSGTLSCRVGQSHAGETVYLSCYNEKQPALDYRESAQVDGEGWAAFRFTHASRYVISQKDLWGAAAQKAGTAAASAAGAAGSAASVVVLPEDQVQAAGESDPDPGSDSEEEPEEASSQPEEAPSPEEEDTPAGTETKSRDTRLDAWVVPLLILFLSAAAAAILLLQMRAGKKRRRR